MPASDFSVEVTGSVTSVESAVVAGLTVHGTITCNLLAFKRNTAVVVAVIHWHHAMQHDITTECRVVRLSRLH